MVDYNINRIIVLIIGIVLVMIIASIHLPNQRGIEINTMDICNDNNNLECNVYEDTNIAEHKDDGEIYEDDAQVLLDSDKVDELYRGGQVGLSEHERKLVERVIMGETSGASLESAALVAQAIKDASIADGLDITDVINNLGYTKNLKNPNEIVVNAVRYIFDEGNYAVKHRVMYFYAPKVTRSNWHESQRFVAEYEGHRYFDRIE